MQRGHHDWGICHARLAKSYGYSVWISGISLERSRLDDGRRFISIESCRSIRTAITKTGLAVTATGVVVVFSFEINNVVDEPRVLPAQILRDGVTISRGVD